MNGHDYYQEVPDNSEQSLETDVMRFIAIIGIVFWLIFTITSSIPQSEVETKPENSPTQVSRSTLNQPETIKPEAGKPEPIKPEIKTSQTLPTPTMQKPKPVGADEQKKTVPEPKTVSKIKPNKKFAVPAKIKPETAPKAIKEQPGKTESHPQPQTKTLSIEFKTLDDLMTLLSKKSVTIFCQIKASGFDLLFRNDRLNRERLPIYTSSTTIPPILWEIKETKTRSFFLAALKKAFPATGNFPDRKVFVAFADAGMEQNIEKILNRLRAEKQGGTIIISGNGTLEFPEPAKP